MKKQAIGVSRANGAGSLPGWLEGIASASSSATVDWREELRRFVTPSSTKRQSWSRPNRRQASSRVMLPGKTSSGVSCIVWVRDTSGSMNAAALESCNAELQAALDEGVIDKLIVIDCDSKVQDVAEYGHGDQIMCTVRGRGGTMFSPAFEWIEENANDAAAIIYFSDMEVHDYGEEPNCPVLFAGYGDPRSLREWAEKRPFGDFVEVTWDD
jgi:predicted metal-dependent peptidase